jgi:hypothetical protein
MTQWWHEVQDISLVQGGALVQPLRFQIPRGYSEYGLSQYNQITLGIFDTQFLEWFRNLEKKLVGDSVGSLESRVKEHSITIKYVDGFSQVFDSSDILMIDGHSFVECELDCLVEIDKVYSLNGNTGITCKIFQTRVFPRENVCLFS